MAASTFAYVVILSKPWHLRSNAAVVVQATAQIVMYSGTFTEADFAAVIEPIARGELVSLPGATGRCVAWRGMATWMSSRQTHLKVHECYWFF